MWPGAEGIRSRGPGSPKPVQQCAGSSCPHFQGSLQNGAVTLFPRRRTEAPRGPRLSSDGDWPSEPQLQKQRLVELPSPSISQVPRNPPSQG